MKAYPRWDVNNWWWFAINVPIYSPITSRAYTYLGLDAYANNWLATSNQSEVDAWIDYTLAVYHHFEVKCNESSHSTNLVWDLAWDVQTNLLNLLVLKLLSPWDLEEQLTVMTLFYLDAVPHIRLTSPYPRYFAVSGGRPYMMHFSLESFHPQGNWVTFLLEKIKLLHLLIPCHSSISRKPTSLPGFMAVSLDVSLEPSISAYWNQILRT